MKVVYGQSIREQIANVIWESKKTGKVVERIELSITECGAFQSDYEEPIRSGRKFMGVPVVLNASL